MSSQNTKAKTDQTQADQVADKAAFHPGAQQDSQPKSQEAAAVQHILTAQQNATIVIASSDIANFIFFGMK